MGQIRTLTAVVLTVVFAQACIIQDRSNCPAYLTLDFSETPKEVSEIHLLLEDRAGYLLKDTLSWNEFRMQYEVPIRRGEICIAAFGNVDKMVFGDGYRIKEGEDADSLYTSFVTTVCNDDLSFLSIKPAKNHIGLHIRLIGECSDSLEILVESSSVGYSLNGDIISGTFRHSPNAHHLPDGNGAYYEFFSKILRQRDDKLHIVVKTASDISLVTIPLSPFLEEAGINMSDEELEDLYMTLDISLSRITLSLKGWGSTEHTEILF